MAADNSAAEGRVENTHPSRLARLFALLIATYESSRQNRTSRLGAALAYYAIFALAPLMIVALGIAGFFLGELAVEGQLAGRVETRIGSDAAKVLEIMLTEADSTATSSVLTGGGMIVLLVTASALFLALQDAFNTIWGVPWAWGIKAKLRRRLLSFAVVVAIGLLLVAVVVADTILAAIDQLLPNRLEVSGVALALAGSALPAILAAFGLALLYKFMPDTNVPWRSALLSGAITAVFMMIGAWLIGLYMGQQNPVTVAGTAGGVLLILLWIYYEAQIVLLGAEFSRSYTKYRAGSLVIVHKDLVDDVIDPTG